MKDLKCYAQILISEDEMECELCLDMVDTPDFYVFEDVMAFLKSHGVIYGIDTAAIKELIKSRVYDKYVVVARGLPAVNGKNGYYTYTFNINPDRKPRLREDGSVDYPNLNLFQSVGEGDLLARYFPKVDGSDGCTVTGKNIRAERGKHLPPLRGKGFTLSEDCMEYYAAYDGKVETIAGGINVTKISTIPGDVGLNVGNLDVRGDLEILGNVISGMSVKATGNITIKGLVEAANITAGKNILIKGGILGGGRAKIEAAGNIFAQFIENALVDSGDCVQANSVVNSIVTAYNDINIFGKTSSIIGGSLKANRMVRTKCIGSSGQIITRISVGVDASVIADLKLKETKLVEEEEELSKIEKAMEMMNTRKDTVVAGTKEMQLLLTRTKIEKTADVVALRNDIKNAKKRIELAKSAEIVAEELVYQGTIISIDGITLKVNNDYEKLVFLRRGDKILTKMYVEENYTKQETSPLKLD